MTDGDDQNVTNAILLTRLDGLSNLVTKQHAETKGQLSSLATDITALKIGVAEHEVRIHRNEQELDGVKRKGVLWDAINSIGAVIAFLMGKVT